MACETREIEAVEAAAAHAWAGVPKPAHHFCPENVPPTEPFVLDPYVWAAAEWLRTNASDVFADVVAVQGQTVWRHAHAWIEARSVATVPERRLVIDVSTPPGCEMYLVASDATLAASAEHERSIYYRRISIIEDGAATAYVRAQAMPAPAAPAAPAVQTAVGRVLLAFQQNAGSRQFVPLDAHVDELATCFLAPDAPADASTHAAARAYAHVLYGMLRRMWISMYERPHNPAGLDDLFESIDTAWRMVFGLSMQWRAHRAALVTCTALSMNERRSLDAVSVAYQRACDAYVAIVAATEERVAAKLAKGRFPLVRVPAVRTPAHDLLVSLLDAGDRGDVTRTVVHSVSMRVAQCYPPRVLYMLERTADLVAAARGGQDGAFASMLGDVNAQRLPWAHDEPAERTLARDQFLTAVVRFARAGHADLVRFQTMLEAWAPVDAAYYTPPAPDTASAPAAPDAGAAATVPRAIVRVCYALGAEGVPLRIELASDDGAADGAAWAPVGELEDLAGNSWTLEAPEGAATGAAGMRVFVESLSAAGAPSIEGADSVRIVAALPPDSRLPEQRAPWVRRTAPYAFMPMLWRMCARAAPGDAWGAFTENVRRAVRVLCACATGSLEAVVVPCPPHAALADPDPTMHEVDQWLVYFMAMPSPVRQFLDVQRKRFGASFFVQRGMAEGEARALVRVTIRAAPRALALPVSGSGAARSLDARLSDAIWDWLTAENGEKSAVVAVPAGVLRAAAVAAIDSNKCVIRPEHVAEDMVKLRGTVKDFMHAGMLFATRRKDGIELEVFRDVSHFFELSFTKNMLALAAAVRNGALPGGAAGPLQIELSSGYLADGVKSAHAHLETTLVVRPGGWRDDTLAFLAGWVRGHLCRAVQSSHVALRLTPLRIEFLPSVELMCRERGVHFMVVAHLVNRLEKRTETFAVSAVPVIDAVTGLCTVNLRAALAQWLALRVFTYKDAEGTDVRVAPYTAVSGKVYMHADGMPAATMGTFLADSSVSHYLRGNGVYVECDTHDIASADAAALRTRAEGARLAVYGIMCGATARPSDADALTVVRALAGYKYFDSFREMPLYAELAERVPRGEFQRAVVREYYANPGVHPRVRTAVCRFGVREFVCALYGRENAFLMSVQ